MMMTIMDDSFTPFSETRTPRTQFNNFKVEIPSFKSLIFHCQFKIPAVSEVSRPLGAWALVQRATASEDRTAEQIRSWF